ncbi:MAG: BREX-2 system adenine-specific DNA-methyltransferase PglX, partial [Planctomycetes bacterium]|nr:BREX-2 system adenine-specific DNA-methyltransferase PglX [Planctomycetota bacterium]
MILSDGRARLHAAALLADLKKLLPRVEADLLARGSDAEVPEIGARLRAEYDRARAAKRTAATFGEWQQDRITQAAVAWVLSCVFARFLEDNDLVTPPRIAGPGDRLQLARDSHQHFFASHPRETDRDYLLAIFDDLAALPGTADLFGSHNALREIPTWLSGDAAKELLGFFQRIDASTGRLLHDFTDPSWDSRFLGDLYQDLSSFARERYALLQTPHFVEQFLLDRTLDPALEEFGASGTELATFKMIDPACGSGHLVLGSFERILGRLQRLEPGTPIRELVRRTLDSVHGVDVNPFAVAIARFRLLLVAMRACGVTKLADAPAFRIRIECGDSLLHTPLANTSLELFDKGTKTDRDEDCDHAYASEDLFNLKAILAARQYHAVVANPPYITPKDPGLRDRYRKRFGTCHMKYSLSVPFMELLYRLCVPGGFTGQITANSFMKREFGSKLIERFFPTVDLTHVIDTSGAYIPGHGTPTVILFGRQRAPVATTVRAVMGIRGEPTTPPDPAKGLVWTAITTQVDVPGSQSDFVSVADTPRATFHAHPWSIGGGGASDLKEKLEADATDRLGEQATAIGITSVTGEDDLYLSPAVSISRRRVDLNRPLMTGDLIRDWDTAQALHSLWTYDSDFAVLTPGQLPVTLPLMWPYRTGLKSRRRFGTPMIQRGLSWYEWQELYADKLRSPLSIAFAFVATHNHFVLDRGGKVFNRSAPVIKLPAEATEDDHLALLGILNSSTACFWMKQVFQTKGSSGIGRGVYDESWEKHHEFTGTGLESFPLPASRPLDLARAIQRVTDAMATCDP